MGRIGTGSCLHIEVVCYFCKMIAVLHLKQPLMDPLLLSLPLPILPRNLPRALNSILIDAQPLKAHRPPRMDLIRTDSHLGPKPKAHPVRHPRTGIPEHACAVHVVEEALCDGCVGG